MGNAKCPSCGTEALFGHGIPECRAQKAEEKVRLLELQVDALKNVAESTMAAYRYECLLQGKDVNEPLESRFQSVVRGVAQKRVEPRQKIVHCGGIGCRQECHCPCEDCMAIKNF